MKNGILKFAVIAGIFAVSLSGCKKYEEGPGISFRSKTTRLARAWKLDKYVDKSGNVQTVNLGKFVFDKDGFTKLTTILTTEGKWHFNDNKSKVITTHSLYEELEILRLTTEDFWVRHQDGGESYFVPHEDQ